MSDVIDQACEREQVDRDIAIAQQARHVGMPATGQCYYCEAPLLNAGCFCNVDCRDDYELLERSNALNYGGRYVRS